MEIKLTVWDRMVRTGIRRQKELAERTGISQSNISNLVNGKAKAIQFDTLASLCAALDCEPGDLLKLEKEEVEA